MKKNKFIYLQRCRIVIAKELDIPPDNVDIISFIDCFERGVEFKADDPENQLMLEPKSQREVDAILSKYGGLILDKMLNQEYPFYDYMEKYEESYVQDYIRHLNEEGKQ